MPTVGISVYDHFNLYFNRSISVGHNTVLVQDKEK